jgi:hypothetical protein
LQTLARILRQIGAIVLIASAATFMLQNWAAMESLYRYGSFLAFTAGLALLGFYCGGIVKEDKGARTFLGIAAAILPAHFAQLGALIYASWLGKAADVPHLFRFEAPGTVETLLTVLCALAILLPVCYAGVSAMARQQALKIVLLFAGLNSLLLIPSRDPALVSLLVVMAMVVPAYYCWNYFSKFSAMQTWEGRAMQAMLYAPSAILIGRSFLYGENAVVIGLGFIFVALAMWFGGASIAWLKSFGSFAQVVSLLPLFVGWLTMVYGMFFSNAAMVVQIVEFADALWVPLLVLPYGVFVSALSYHAIDSGVGYRKFAAWFVSLAMLWHLVEDAALLSSFLCVLTMIAAITSAFVLEDRNILKLGFGGLCLSLGYHLWYAIDLVDISPWLSLAITGTIVVLASTRFEKHSRYLGQQLDHLRTEIDGWAS